MPVVVRHLHILPLLLNTVLIQLEPAYRAAQVLQAPALDTLTVEHVRTDYLPDLAVGLEIAQADTAVGHGRDVDLLGQALGCLFLEVLDHDLLVVELLALGLAVAPASVHAVPRCA